VNDAAGAMEVRAPAVRMFAHLDRRFEIVRPDRAFWDLKTLTILGDRAVTCHDAVLFDAWRLNQGLKIAVQKALSETAGCIAKSLLCPGM
jgi:hypothetical protein